MDRVENVTSETLDNGKQRTIYRIRTEHKRKYLIPLLHRDRLKSLYVLNNGSVKILLDPKGDRNCQFEAIVDWLSKHGNFTTASRLRKTTVYHLKWHEEFYGYFLGQEFSEYIRKMSKDGKYGDNLTLQALAREFYNI